MKRGQGLIVASIDFLGEGDEEKSPAASTISVAASRAFPVPAARFMPRPAPT